MAVVQSQYTNANRDIHLRDYRHARNLYYEYGLAFAPKTKYLFHCLFEPSPEVGNSATKNSFAFQKHLGVLVKTTDLPSFRVSVENKKQYNRIKQYQTRLDYQDVNMTFHDDNLGVTRALFEEYYKYYFLDGRHNVQKGAIVSGPYASRDKYSPTVPKYGLNTGNVGPFFNSITIYQLSRQEYFAYTLVNPIITQWDHGDADMSDASGMNENTMSIAYESVLMTNGNIGEDSQPVAFADPETGYDQTPSPLSEPDLRGRGNQYASGGPRLLELAPPTAPSRPTKNNTTTVSVPFSETEKGQPGKTFNVPKTDTKNRSAPIAAPKENTYKRYAGSEIAGALGSSPARNSPIKGQDRLRARQSFTAKAINSGAVPGVTDMKTFKQLYPTASEQNAVTNALVDRAAEGDQKLVNIASESIGEFK